MFELKPRTARYRRPPAPKRTAEQVAAERRERDQRRRAELREDWCKTESINFRNRNNAEETERSKRRRAEYVEQLQRVHEKLCSAEFKSWYEATTGEPVDDFLANVAISEREWLARGLNRPNYSQLDWTKGIIELIAARNPWKNPEMIQHWIGYLDGCEDASERRYILLRLATPVWADRRKMLAVYRERDRITIETGVKHHVDHVIPIVHPYVCGLNYEGNLRVITAEENQQKSNFFNGVKGRAGKKKKFDKKKTTGHTSVNI